MSLERAVMAFAGVMVLISLALTHYVSPWWWLLTAFVGLNLLQSAFTGFCPAGDGDAQAGRRAQCLPAGCGHR